MQHAARSTVALNVGAKLNATSQTLTNAHVFSLLYWSSTQLTRDQWVKPRTEEQAQRKKKGLEDDAKGGEHIFDET